MKNYVNYSTRSGISDSTVLDIRSNPNNMSVRDLAYTYGIPKSTIHDILVYKTWTHVPSPKSLKAYGNYEIYPDGRILSVSTGKFLRPKADKEGIVKVEVTTNGRRKTVPVAALVAKAFLGKKNPTKVSYRDDNSRNVHFTNLIV